MKNKAIIDHIKHYMNKDICKGAIMLTGAWGTGKSHFIKKELIPAMKAENKKCVVVSLYGLECITEISKNIYLELRAKILKPESEIVATVAPLAKTVVSGIITGRFGINISASDDDLKNLYESIDLKDKLIILEDIERSKIPIHDLLGYVNSLVEQDGVKVLLITNEAEYLKYENIEIEENYSSNKKTKRTVRRPTTETKQYLRIKEKSINDTIIFEGDYHSAIESIILEYDSPLLHKFSFKESIDDILTIMKSYRCFNLRSFAYACQKTVDIFDKMPQKYNSENQFLRSIFFGNISFILKLKEGKEISWKNEKDYSIELGNSNDPLFRFCYDYITNQTLDISKIDSAFDAFKDYKMYISNATADKDLKPLIYYYRSNDKEINSAVKSITHRLKQKTIPYSLYGRIALQLVYVKHFLRCDIEEAKSLLISNLKGKGIKIQPNQLFNVIMGDDATATMHEEYISLQKEMSDSLNTNASFIRGFNYMPDQITIFQDYIRKNEWTLNIDQGFAQHLDMQKLAELFSNCSNDQKDDIRCSFCSMYNRPDIKLYLGQDYNNVKELKKIISEGANNPNEDIVGKLQYKMFDENLSEILSKLS